jgi:hypothetical protein
MQHAGETSSFWRRGLDAYIVKLDSSGILLWSRTVGGIYNEYSYSIIQTTDGGYAINAAIPTLLEQGFVICTL